LKVIWHDGQGACLFTKRLERGRFLWPSAADGAVMIRPIVSMPYVVGTLKYLHRNTQIVHDLFDAIILVAERRMNRAIINCI
jgi:transposase